MKKILVTGGTSYVGKHCIAQLIEKGYTGRKGKGGFYRINKDNNQKILEAGCGAGRILRWRNAYASQSTSRG